MNIELKNKILYLNNYKLRCSIGKRGITANKKEGDEKTPRGIFDLKTIFYRRDRISKLKSSLKKTIIKKNMGWCDDPNSSKYNQLITKPFKFSHESLYKVNNTYDIILVLNYNMNPIKNKKGSAIFIHIAKKNYSKTEGCVAINKKTLLKIIKEIKINTKVKISDQK